MSVATRRREDPANRQKRRALRAVGLWIAASLLILALAVFFALPRSRRATDQQAAQAPVALEPGPDPRPSGNATEPTKP